MIDRIVVHTVYVIIIIMCYFIVSGTVSAKIAPRIYGIVSAKRDLVHIIKFVIKVPYV